MSEDEEERESEPQEHRHQLPNIALHQPTNQKQGTRSSASAVSNRQYQVGVLRIHESKVTIQLMEMVKILLALGSYNFKKYKSYS